MLRWCSLVLLVLGMAVFLGGEGAAQKSQKTQKTEKKGQKEQKGQKGQEIHDPSIAVANLEIHPALQATLFISEPKITNPTNLDIDHRGRIWLCDVVNYRGNNGKRKEGDRILILEDTDGDGVADTVKTFYQGRDIDSAMGICVLGDKLIVSASPNVFVFHFDKDDKVIKKDVLFTKTGIAQHDHSAHSFVFGPDGRLYWNFGNTGNAVHDRNGKPVVDIHGNLVNASAKPYRQGMVFRCEMDGSNFEVLGHNFRNNYEVAVDSFGTLWQSDNDDDGNRSVRINYVMEYGNFGYVDEMTGAGWRTKRTNLEREIPLQHWHQNDPGVVPNLLNTGGGSPTGICVYEGSLLSRAFAQPQGLPQGRLGGGALPIHCDAGPSIVRAYPATKDGAGFKAEVINILDGAKKNNWFRPADVCVAPDGSLFVTDWYDPGVGGHQQRDSDRGRIFRVAPPSVKYQVPKYNFETIEGNIEALKSPNLATRYLAWTNLHKAGAKAESALLKLFDSPIALERARALWLLGRIEGKGKHYVKKGQQDKDPSIQVVAIRLGRQLKLDWQELMVGVVGMNQANREVLREAAIALRYQKATATHNPAQAWAELALAHTGNDRWYLESLGIGADKNWDLCLEKYLAAVQAQASKGKAVPEAAVRDILWRSRATQTPTHLANTLLSDSTPFSALPALLRAFDFQTDSSIKNEVLLRLAFEKTADPKRETFINGEAITRLQGFDITKNPKHAATLNALLDRSEGTSTFVELVTKFQVSKRYPQLLGLAQKRPTEQIGIDAIRVLLDRDQFQLIQAGLNDKDRMIATNTAQAIAGAGHDKANSLLLPIIQNAQQDLELRRQATRALARNRKGAKQLLKLVQSKKLAPELEVAASSVLLASNVRDIRALAEQLFPQPTTKDKKPLPAIADLVKIKGNAANGREVFMKLGTCANCHIVNGEGKNVGPDLSEIGKKLAREAMFESILYPSASILHNYENYLLETKSGTTANGLLVSTTPEEITLKGPDALSRTFKKSQVSSFTRLPVSLMPADLHQLMTTQQLADVVEFMTTLQMAKKP